MQPEDRMQAEAPGVREDITEMFQSSSSPKTGCKSGHATTAERTTTFQSSSSPKTGCKSGHATTAERTTTFQSSSSPKTGCKRFTCQTCGDSYHVSILIQPEDRMQAMISTSHTDVHLFQSSSSPKTGCKIPRGPRSAGVGGSFNPHPARRPDASRCGSMDSASTERVSILIQPEDRMQVHEG